MAGRRWGVRLLAAALLYFSGVVSLTRWWVQRRGTRLVILAYHRASHPNLRRQLLYLRRHYRVLPLETALEELCQYEHAPTKHQRRRAERRTALAITFDDGYQDNYTHAFALARELHVPITIFLIAGYVESGQPFWWLEGERLAQHTRVSEPTVLGQRFSLADSEGARAELAATIDMEVRNASSVPERERFLRTVRTALAVPSEPQSPEEVASRPLTWAEAREMAASGWVSFGAHTMHHPVLACLADPAEVEREVSECRCMLQQQLGRPVRVFAYPLGRHEHIGPYAVSAVQRAGYAWGVTMVRDVNTPQTDPYLLHRIAINHDEHWLVIAVRVADVWRTISRLLTRKAKPSIRP